MRFAKKDRLLKRTDYLKASRTKRCFFGGAILIEYSKTSLGYCRLGITVSRKYGGAVQRNYFKRVVREAFRQLPDAKEKSYDLNVRPKASKTNKLAVDASLASVQEDFKKLAEYFSRSAA